MLETVVLTIVGIVGSWFITHVYYQKSMKNLSTESNNQIRDLLKEIADGNSRNAEQLRNQQRLEDAIAEYERYGTPVRIIDTYTDLSKEQKAELYDAVMMRVKGRKGKSNKYRLP